MKDKKVIGGYRCVCTYGTILQSERLEYCEKHGKNIANEYEVPVVTLD